MTICHGMFGTTLQLLGFGSECWLQGHKTCITGAVSQRRGESVSFVRGSHPDIQIVEVCFAVCWSSSLQRHRPPWGRPLWTQGGTFFGSARWGTGLQRANISGQNKRAKSVYWKSQVWAKVCACYRLQVQGELHIMKNTFLAIYIRTVCTSGGPNSKGCNLKQFLASSAKMC